MKKFLALVMAMMMILAMGTVAFADEEKTDHASISGTYSLPITKTYNGGKAKVNETITFAIALSSVVDEYGNSVTDTSSYVTGTPSITTLTLTDGNWEQDENSGYCKATGNVTVSWPTFNKAGVYTFTVKEQSSTGAGVTLATSGITLKVYVGYNDGGALKILNTEFRIKDADGNKQSHFDNTLTTGGFTVEKKVTGTMASNTETFSIVVTLTSSSPVGNAVTAPDSTELTWAKTSDGKYTATKILTISQNSGAQTFSNVPSGLTVTVSEESGQKGYTTKSIVCGNEKVETLDDGTMSLSATQDKSLVFTVTNEKNDTIDTGISMDNAPYMMVMALVVLAGAAMLLKKRAYND